MTNPEVNFAALGTAVGEALPCATLTDQQGRQIDLHADRNGRPAVVVFHRSARW